MMRITSTEIDCTHCGKYFRIMWEASINTWLDPELIQKLLDDKYYYSCPNCEKQIHLVTKILINCPKGMFWISTDEKLDTKKRILMEYNVIDEDRKILIPIIGVDRPVDNHPGLVSEFAKEIEKLKNDLLSNNKSQLNEKNKEL